MKAVLRLVVAALLVVTVPSVVRAGPFVLPGWDLLQTLPSTTFFGTNWNGVSLGSFDFGGTIGVESTGPNTDTIVERKGTADDPSETIPIELVALQLVSTTPVDFGAGLDFHYVTLQSARGGPASPGEMTIDFLPDPADPHGDFGSFFDVFFDLRIGALNGPIISSGMEHISTPGYPPATSIPWSHFPPPGAWEITGVNRFLNGVDRDADFWPGPIQECTLAGGCHFAITAVPEPASVLLLGVGFAGALLRARNKRPRGRTP